MPGMAKFSSILGQVSGSQAGITFSRNKWGQYIRRRAIPVNPNTPDQTAARNLLVALATRWKTLSASQQLGWSTLGDQITREDSLGQPYTLSGIQAYIMVNATRDALGLAVIDDAPPMETVWDPGTVTVAADSVAQTVTITFTGTSGLTDRLNVFATDGRSAGVNFFSSGLFRLISSTTNPTSPLDISAAYLAKFGALIAGEKVAVRLVPITDSGIPGTDIEATTIVT